MAGSSVYQQRKHRKITGLVNAQRASKCFNCGSVYEYGTLLRGWCATCIANWTTAEAPSFPSVYATQADAIAAGASVCPVSARQLESIKNYALTPKKDREFIPLTMFKGGVSIGQVQTWMNVLHAMKTINAASCTEARAIVTALPDAAHICGRHHRMGSDQIRGFFNRLNSASAFVVDPDTRDYLRGFIADNRLWIYALQPINEFDSHARRPWRRLKKTCRQCHCVLGAHRSVFCSEPCATGYRNEQARLHRPSRAGRQNHKIPAVWPFLSQAATQEHELLLKVDCAVPKTLPHQMREDVCQDLIVSVLSGDISIDQLQGAVAKHIARVFKLHPTKYGPLSLDQPAPWANGDDRPLSELLAVSDSDADWDVLSGVDGFTESLDGPIRDAFGEIIYMPGRLTTDYAKLISRYGKEPWTTQSVPNALTSFEDEEAIPFWRPHGDHEQEAKDS